MYRSLETLFFAICLVYVPASCRVFSHALAGAGEANYNEFSD